MATELKSILRNPNCILAFKAGVFVLLFYFYALNPSVWRGVLLVVVPFWIYSRPLFNFLAPLSTLLVLLALALWAGWLAYPLLWIEGLLLAFSFAVILGIKNLVLIYRHAWHYLVAFLLCYLALLNFFLLDKSSWFTFKWLFLIIILFLIFRDLPISKTAAGILILLLAELTWLVNWLPIGPLGLANLSLLFILFSVDVLVNKKILWRHLGLLFLLIIIIFFSSRWTLVP